MEIATAKSSFGLQVVEHNRTQRDGAVVVDVEFGKPNGVGNSAFLIQPPGGAPWPAVLYLHWYAQEPTANRTQFLEEGVQLARRGVVSLHVQGRFPWLEDPSGIDHDRAALIDQLLDVRRAVDLLTDRADIDGSRIVFVGHDFGAMFGALLASIDRRLRALVMVAPVPHWADWFVPYWPVLGALSETAYRERLADLDPATALPAIAPRPMFFQFARDDEYVSTQLARLQLRLAGESASATTYPGRHDLADAAVSADRVGWLMKVIADL